MTSPGSNVPARSSFLVFGQPLIGEEEKREILDSLDKAWLGTGPKVAPARPRFTFRASR